MLPKIRIVGTLVLCVAFCAFLIPLSGAQQDEATEYLVRPNLTGARGGNLVVSISSDPATFNRMFTQLLANAMVAEQLSADLVHINRRTFEVEPSLAARWEVARDGRTYTLHLRRGLRFSDGSPCTADDVVFTLNALQDPRNPSIMANQVRIEGKFPAVAKIDANTIRLEWPRPVGTGLRALDSVPILPRNRLLKAYQDGALASAWSPTTPPQQIAGLGPFRLKEYQRGQRVVLERNPYYGKKDKNGAVLPYLDTLTFVVIPDPNVEVLRFQAGEIDLIGRMSPESFVMLRRSDRAKEFTLQDLGPGLGMDFLWFNLNPGKSPAGAPFVDPEKLALFARPEFRRAVSYALDREGMARSILLGLGTPQYGPISSGNKTWYDPALTKTPHDPAQARKLLAQIGLKDTNGDGILEFGGRGRALEIVLYTLQGGAAREKTAEIIRQDLTQVGIRLSVQALPPSELGRRLTETFDYESMLFGVMPSDVVPDLLTDVWHSSGGNHFWFPGQAKPATSWEAQIDALTSKSELSLDPAVRLKSFLQIQEIWAQQLPTISTMAPNILAGWRNTVGNTSPAVLPPFLLWNAEELTKRAR